MTITAKVTEKTIVDKTIKYKLQFYLDNNPLGKPEEFETERLTDELIKSKIKQKEVALSKTAIDESTIVIGDVVSIDNSIGERQQFDIDHYNLGVLLDAQARGYNIPNLKNDIDALKSKINLLDGEKIKSYLGLI